jgi:hypothetical protein
MKHRLKPGGPLLLVEPNNFFNRLPTSSAIATLSPVEYGQLAAFWWAFERGRAIKRSVFITIRLPGARPTWSTTLRSASKQ